VDKSEIAITSVVRANVSRLLNCQSRYSSASKVCVRRYLMATCLVGEPIIALYGIDAEGKNEGNRRKCDSTVSKGQKKDQRLEFREL
jgi:hypothetical protein